MSSWKTFMESLKSVDMTSVGTSFITSAVISSGASKGLKAAVGGANLLDAGVDYSIDDGFSSIADNKTIEEAFVGFAIDVASSEASKAMQKAFVKDANAKLAPSVAAPLMKAERASLRSRKAFAESETFSVMLDDLFSFTSGMVENVTFELVLPPRNIEKEKEDD